MNREKAVYDVLRYFHFFHHGLTVEEVRAFCAVPSTPLEIKTELRTMVTQGEAYESEGYYAIDTTSIHLRRKYRAKNRRMLAIARIMGWIMMRFPFVRGVYVSGSLSKGGVQNSSDDIDYFIVTQPNRVWTSKFLLTLFKKIVLLNSKKYFCINFFRDAEHLAFNKQNIYVATEIATLIPLQNKALLHALWDQNKWIYNYFPNLHQPVKTYAPKPNKSPFERLWELIWGDRLEHWAHTKYKGHFAQKSAVDPNHHMEKSRNSAAYFPDSMENQVLSYYN